MHDSWKLIELYYAVQYNCLEQIDRTWETREPCRSAGHLQKKCLGHHDRPYRPDEQNGMCAILNYPWELPSVTCRAAPILQYLATNGALRITLSKETHAGFQRYLSLMHKYTSVIRKSAY